MRVAIITSSDSGAQGLREDRSGSVIREIAGGFGADIVSYDLLPDEQTLLSEKMIEIADGNRAELILTTGGTGFSKRDCMPEATLAVAERMVPGIPEAMRAYSMQFTGRAMLSRAAAGIRGNTLIVNLPGSPKAVRETLEYIFPHLEHGIEILTGTATDCARSEHGHKDAPHGGKVFGICGAKDSGKTTFLENLVAELKRAGMTVAVIKHDGHDFEADVKGTDSRRLYEAGADETAVFSGSQVLIHKRESASWEQLIEQFSDCDVVLLEGGKNLPVNKLEIVRCQGEPMSNPEGRLGFVTDVPALQEKCKAENIPVFGLDDAAAVADLIQEKLQLKAARR